MACVFLISAAACGGTPAENDPGGTDNPSGSAGQLKDGEINIFLPIDSDSETAFKNVGNSYTKMMKAKGITVRVNVRSSQDPQGYITSVDGLLKIRISRRVILYRQTRSRSITDRANLWILRRI